MSTTITVRRELDAVVIQTWTVEVPNGVDPAGLTPGQLDELATDHGDLTDEGTEILDGFNTTITDTKEV